MTEIRADELMVVWAGVKSTPGGLKPSRPSYILGWGGGWGVREISVGGLCAGNFSPAMGARNQVGMGCRTVPPAYVAWLLNSRLGSWNQFLSP